MPNWLTVKTVRATPPPAFGTTPSTPVVLPSTSVTTRQVTASPREVTAAPPAVFTAPETASLNSSPRSPSAPASRRWRRGLATPSRSSNGMKMLESWSSSRSPAGRVSPYSLTARPLQGAVSLFAGTPSRTAAVTAVRSTTASPLLSTALNAEDRSSPSVWPAPPAPPAGWSTGPFSSRLKSLPDLRSSKTVRATSPAAFRTTPSTPVALPAASVTTRQVTAASPDVTAAPPGVFTAPDTSALNAKETGPSVPASTRDASAVAEIVAAFVWPVSALPPLRASSCSVTLSGAASLFLGTSRRGSSAPSIVTVRLAVALSPSLSVTL